jgi:curved DNA-binding protein CbpA
VAGRNLYAILEVPERADRETIQAAYAAALSKLEGGAGEAVANRLAVTEAYRILSDDRLRSGYDSQLQVMRAPPAPVPQVESRSWFSGFRSVAIVLVLLAVPAYVYNEKRIERLANEKALELRRAEERKQREENEARRAEAAQQNDARNEERRKRLEEARQHAQEQQDRARGAYNTMVVNRQIETENRNAEQASERQRRAEEMQRAREENEARMRLEEDKRRLRQYQCSNGPC